MFSGRLNLIDRPLAKGKSEVSALVSRGSQHALQAPEADIHILPGQPERILVFVQRNGSVFPDSGLEHW